jgi:hypothetical protein
LEPGRSSWTALLRTGSALCGVITLVAPIQVDLDLAGDLLVLLYYGVTGIRHAASRGASLRLSRSLGSRAAA